MFIAVPNTKRFILCSGFFLKFQQRTNDGRIDKGDIGHIHTYFLCRIDTQGLVDCIAQILLG